MGSTWVVQKEGAVEGGGRRVDEGGIQARRVHGRQRHVRDRRGGPRAISNVFYLSLSEYCSESFILIDVSIGRPASTEVGANGCHVTTTSASSDESARGRRGSFAPYIARLSAAWSM